MYPYLHRVTSGGGTMNNDEALIADAKSLVQVLLELEKIRRPYYGKIILHVQSDQPTLVEFDFTRKLASPEHREPSNTRAPDGGSVRQAVPGSRSQVR